MSLICKMPAATSAVPKIGCVVALAAFTAMPGWAQERFEVRSPGGVVTVTLEVQNGTPTYSVTRLGAEILEPSALGVRFAEGPSFDGGLSLTGTETASFDETWEQVWGEKRNIRNHYNELRATFETEGETTRSMDVVFRVYDDGFGLRYEWPEQDTLGAFEIADELTTFDMAGDPIAWWIPAYGRTHYEYLWRDEPLSALDGNQAVHTPLTMETGDGLYLSIHEAALVDYSSMSLLPMGDGVLKADLAPWGGNDGFTLVRGEAPLVSPWRTMQIADTPGGLIESYQILNLNEPNALEDRSWIEPAKYIGIWWNMHLGDWSWGTGPNHGATTEHAKTYIDFAAEHDLPNVLIEGWNTGWTGRWWGDGVNMNFTEATEDFDLEEVMAYAAERGVNIVGHHETGGAVPNYEAQLEDALALYARHGVPSVKQGYVDFGQGIEHDDAGGVNRGEWHYGQYMVEHDALAREAFARAQIAMNPHEPVKDTGLRRTYPHVMTREGARGQEYNSPGGGGNPVDYTTVLPFTRMLSGPMDFTPGIFDLGPDKAHHTPSTLANQLALYVVIYSPLQMATDLPEHYEANLDAFQFIKDVAVDWDDTRVLNGRIGDYVTIARKERDGEDWYIGSITDEIGRSFEVPLSFLEADREYVAEIYRDGPDADWKTTPLDIEITEALVDASTVMELRLAPGGGQAIRFRPASEEEYETMDEYAPE
ncbi:alpha-glucosidase [Palleronia aestuarii]|uniref:Alpha-glucosidase n=1 Tax=Palleronia aestuarii TaxID=568105 RepID=A0A2W7N249_9RHOB|nr:glycoside hydrolase family 97 protein [Palleronia aestuarii]PZX10944.1 alpha-glucosidase [Palleronia aestuarii]